LTSRSPADERKSRPSWRSETQSQMSKAEQGIGAGGSARQYFRYAGDAKRNGLELCLPVMGWPPALHRAAGCFAVGSGLPFYRPLSGPIATAGRGCRGEKDALRGGFWPSWMVCLHGLLLQALGGAQLHGARGGVWRDPANPRWRPAFSLWLPWVFSRVGRIARTVPKAGSGLLFLPGRSGAACSRPAIFVNRPPKPGLAQSGLAGPVPVIPCSRPWPARPPR